MERCTSYINQGRVEADRSPISARRLCRILLSRPARLTGSQRELIDKVAAGCTEMCVLLERVRAFAALLDPRSGELIKRQMYGRAGFPLLRVDSLASLGPGQALTVDSPDW